MDTLNFEMYKYDDVDGERWRWRFLEYNGSVLAQSKNSFDNNADTHASIKNIQAEVNVNTPIVKEGSEDDKANIWKFKYKEIRGGGIAWWLETASKEIIAIGGEGINDKEVLTDEIKKFANLAPNADIGYENPSDDPAEDAKQQESDSGHEPKGVPGS